MIEPLELDFKDAMTRINTSGFSSVDLTGKIPEILGKPLYLAMDEKDLHSNKNRYYNEIAFCFEDDWKDVPEGLRSFHDESTIGLIYGSHDVAKVFNQQLGCEFSSVILEFAKMVKRMVLDHHCGFEDNKLRLARCMVRQMNDRHRTSHLGSDLHEDQGYPDRPYRQMVSAVLTTYGIPTISDQYSAKVGEMLIFNAKDRRVELGLSADKAFLHRGPKSGPKLFFFFEFLGANPRFQNH